MHDLVGGLLVSREVVPEPGQGEYRGMVSTGIYHSHCGVFQIGLWIPLLGMDENGKFRGIT